MNRTIEYLITEKKTDSGLNNSYEGKDIPVRILPKSNVCQKVYLVNGVHYYMRQTLTARRHS